MAAFEKDQNVWFNHPVDTWIPCVTKNAGTGNIKVVVTETGEEFEAEASSGDLMPLHESSLTDVDDMVQLGDMNDAALLHNLRLRYKVDNIFTCIGPILIAVNPYKAIPIYGPEFVDKYHNPPRSQEPHVYALAEGAYLQMRDNKHDQSVVISGESGAGKTEETKLCLQYLAEIAGKGGEGVIGKEQLLLDCSPILESFGNAKTVRNNNSSRFGKYLEIMFDADGGIIGGMTTQYLLEKSRIVQINKGERNYHIFYQLLRCLPQDESAKYFGDKAPEWFFYLNQSGIITFPGEKDAKEWEDVMRSWDTLGISVEERHEIYSIVAAVAFVGNCNFEGDDDGCEVEDGSVCEQAATLLECDPDLMDTTLTHRNMSSGGRSIVVIPLKPSAATESRNSLAKAIFGRLFIWLVDRLNEAIKTDEGAEVYSAIGVLDIFGFEIFEINSFEQLCINLANEKLQFHFNGHIFKLEQDTYVKENLDIAAIDFVDNQGCLDMIEKKPKGIFPMLDEECVVPKGTDDTLLRKLEDTHRKNRYFLKPKKGSKNCFVVGHFAGGVSYSVAGFLDKNRDQLLPDLAQFLAESDMGLVKTLFPPPKPQKGKQPTLGGQFKASLQSLYNKLMSTEPHFIKCVKPNTVKQPGVFESIYTLGQLQNLGMLEVIRIRQAGYPVRREPTWFFHRYKVLDPNAKDATALADKIGQKGEWQMGKTMLFMKDDMNFRLETDRALVLDKVCRVMQGFMKSELARSAFTKLMQGVVGGQSLARGVAARTETYWFKIMRNVEGQLNQAIADRDASLLDNALSAADMNSKKYPEWVTKVHKDTTSTIISLVNQAAKLATVVQKENKVYDALTEAIESSSPDKIKIALNEAKAIKYNDPIVDRASSVLNSLKSKKDSKNREKAVAETKVELQEAVDMSDDDLDAKRDALNLAISHADQFAAYGSEFDAAQDALKSIMSNMEGVEALETAIEKGETARIEAAIETAQESGIDTSKATEKLEEVSKVDTAISALEEALRNKNDLDAISKAVDLAKKTGVGEENEDLLLEAKSILLLANRLKDTKDAKRQVLMELEKSDTGKWLEDKNNRKLFKLANSDLLQAHTNMAFQRAPLKTSLVNFTTYEHSFELVTKSLASFNSILGYIGVRKMQYPAMLAMEIIERGIDEEEMRDEIYLQVMKQTDGAPEDIYKRGLQLLKLCTGAFPPSEKCKPYLKVFIKDKLVEAERLQRATDIEFFNEMMDNVKATLGGEGRAPTVEEIDAAYNDEAVYTTVYFLDDSIQRYKIDDSTTVADLQDQVAESLNPEYQGGYPHADTCALYDAKSFGDSSFLSREVNVLELMTKWQEKLDTKLSKKLGVKKVTSHKFVYKKRLFFKKQTESENITDAVDLHILFFQARHGVKSGTLKVTEVEALLLASLNLQIDYGDFNPDQHAEGFLKSQVSGYFNPKVYRLHHASVWERDLTKTYEKMAGFDNTFAKKNYLRVVEAKDTYGYTLFLVKQFHVKKAARGVYLGVSGDGVKLFETQGNTVIKDSNDLSFGGISSWTCVAGESCTIKTQKYQLKFDTRQGEDICALLKEYAQYIVAKKKK